MSLTSGARLPALCERCGERVRVMDLTEANGRGLCPGCVERLGAPMLRLLERVQGRRSPGVWVFGGIGALLSLLVIAALAVELAEVSRPARARGLVVAIAVVSVAAVTLVGFWSLQPWSLRALRALPGIAAAGVFLHAALEEELGFAAGEAALVGGIVGVLAYAARASPRTKAAFGLELSDAELQRLYRATRNNDLALYGLGLTLLGLIAPGFGELGLACALFAWRAVDSEAEPPVGRLIESLIGLVLGLVALTKDLVLLGLMT